MDVTVSQSVHGAYPSNSVGKQNKNALFFVIPNGLKIKNRFFSRTKRTRVDFFCGFDSWRLCTSRRYTRLRCVIRNSKSNGNPEVILPQKLNTKAQTPSLANKLKPKSKPKASSKSVSKRNKVEATQNTSSSSVKTSPESKRVKKSEEKPKSKPEANSRKRLRNVFRKGDYVKHFRYGIGRFAGLEMSSDGKYLQEHALILYQDGDLMVPVTQLEHIQHYEVRADRKPIQLDCMTCAKAFDDRKMHRANSRARRNARVAIRAHIVNMHGLYATRRSYYRPRYETNEKLETQFSDLFPYEMTKDQKRAISEICRDMSESDVPMDRLICGDVGFGKTEVAMRAIFRAVCAGKQVGVLAPTTILAQQHFVTISERMAAFEQISVSRLTRFVGALEKESTLNGLERGEIQIVVGTHSLLSNRVVFANLGLLVVDEEHRFGVNQKDKLRSENRGVDVLTLSATPIPRTLHISMSGLRDVSVINTPPISRKPVITKVVQYGASIVRDAIELEIDRQGQLFYVVPRISMMERAQQWLLSMFPGLRIIMANAEMRDLEDRVMKFANGEADVLLCTTIIENGIDLPKVNTMIIEEACIFGLAQLHQLRGRVGRGDQQAYAYLMYEGSLSKTNGYDRISTLEELSDLGSGFALANRDMEMRGVGNIMGVEQSGRMGGLDVEEYTEMLCEELEFSRLGIGYNSEGVEGKDEEKESDFVIDVAFPTSKNTEVFLPLSALIPTKYTNDSVARKMAVYGAFCSANSLEELKRAEKLTENRFGPMPIEAKHYVKLRELNLMGRTLGINRIYVETNHVILEWAIDPSLLRKLLAVLDDRDGNRRFLHIVSDERVQIRGLALSKPDVILAKLHKWLYVLYLAAVEMQKAREIHLQYVRNLVNENEKKMKSGNVAYEDGMSGGSMLQNALTGRKDKLSTKN